MKHLPRILLLATGVSVAFTAAAECVPVKTGSKEASFYEPAFSGQTRTCAVITKTPLVGTVIAKGLTQPWSLEPLPDGQWIVSEKPGTMRLVSVDGKLGQPIAGIPAVDGNGQGGLLDIALSPDFKKDRTVYWSFSEPRQGGNGTSVAHGVLSVDGTKMEQVSVIFHAQPTYNSRLHFGSRLAFGPDGMLYVTTGERADLQTRPLAQQLNNDFGKVLRIKPDGSPAPDNPFVGKPNALPEVYTYGHRNVQASAFDGAGRLWTIEHGPRGGDELNLIQPGKNYGWPINSYGIEYTGFRIENSVTQSSGLEQPVYYWDPVIAPSGAQFYSGDEVPEWQGNLFIGALRQARLVRLVLKNDRVVGEEHLLVERGQRIRDVKQGNDGALYVVNDDGELLRIGKKK